jgi:putative phosphoribosyl transferase
VVLGLPRGGVPIAAEVAAALDAPLDVIVVRKLGVPIQPELAMGAIGEGGACVFEPDVVVRSGVDGDEWHQVLARERATLEARVADLRQGRPRPDLTGRVAVVVDDGVATGSTARVACSVARRWGAATVVLAVPVGAAQTLRELKEPDEVVCVSTPTRFSAVGRHYRDFSPTTDRQVVAALAAARRREEPRI